MSTSWNMIYGTIWLRKRSLMRDDIERALREEMKKEMEKQKTQLYASLKIELLEEIRKDITSPIKKSNLEFKDNMMHILKKCWISINKSLLRKRRSREKMHLHG